MKYLLPLNNIDKNHKLNYSNVTLLRMVNLKISKVLLIYNNLL